MVETVKKTSHVTGRKKVRGIKNNTIIQKWTSKLLLIGVLLALVLLLSCSEQNSQSQDDSQDISSPELSNQEVAPVENPQDSASKNTLNELRGLEEYYSNTWFYMGCEIDPYYDANERSVYWRIGLYNNYGSMNPDVQYIDEVDYAVVFRDEYGTPIGSIYQQYRGYLGGSYVPGQGVSDSDKFSIDKHLDGRIPVYCDVYFFRVSKVDWEGNTEVWGTDITQLDDESMKMALFMFGRSPSRFNEINGVESENYYAPERQDVTYYPPTQLYETP
jgi:hypothetical protein